jgi:hypothetical protein
LSAIYSAAWFSSRNGDALAPPARTRIEEHQGEGAAIDATMRLEASKRSRGYRLSGTVKPERR